MSRRALIIGINEYQDAGVTNLSGAVRDAELMAAVLERHEDGSPNFECRTHLNPGTDLMTRALLRAEWEALFAQEAEAALFYFAGHGTPTDIGGFIVTYDATTGEPGLPMSELLERANQSKAREVLLILDCCFSGSLGNPPSMNSRTDSNQAVLREGVTILAASRPTEGAAEIGGQGVFTSMVLHALHGGAADVLGRVSAASIYAHAEQALGAWDQRPLYKSHASRLNPVRKCEPAVPLKFLRLLPTIFPDPLGTLMLDPAYEHTHQDADPDKVATFNNLKLYRNARLVRTTDHDDLYFAALGSTGVRLTGLGRYYWRLAKDGRF